MEKFEVSPDDCLILKAFKDARSLREAAKLLDCDPAGLARRVQTISSQHGFLQKVDNRWHLTSQGLDLVAWTEASIQAQKKILLSKSTLRIGSTMWFTEEILIPRLAHLQKSLGESASLSLQVPQQGFERALMDGSVDIVVVCHPPESPEIEHKKLFSEEWAVIIPKSWKLSRSNPLAELKELPFIRHGEINVDNFIPEFENFLDAKVKIDNLIGIRAAVVAGLGWSLVPRILVQQHLSQKLIAECPIELNTKDRHVCMWWLRNRFEIKRQSVKIAQWLNDGHKSSAN